MTSSTTYRITSASAADWHEMVEVDQVAFHHTHSAEEAAAERSVQELERALLARAEPGGELVGMAGAYSFTMTVPGGAYSTPRPR